MGQFNAEWKTVGSKVVRIVYDDDEPYELDVCEVLPSTRKKEHLNLIVSAPSLLWACNFALQSIKRGQVDDLTIQVLENAISRALGISEE